MSLTLMYITNDVDVALIAEKNGVDRIWIDLETLGKEERQKGLNTVKSRHTLNDIKRIKPVLSKAELLVRINPWNEKSPQEISEVLSAGVDIIMLPMWKSVSEVRKFLACVNGRCKTSLLLETRGAEECLDKVLANYKIDEIHIGLNDLHLSYNLDFMFEVLANGTIDSIIEKIKVTDIPYGFGGIAKIGFGDLPAEKVIMEHYRLESTRAILSRSFCDVSKSLYMSQIEKMFSENMKDIREYEKKIADCTKEDFDINRAEVCSLVESIVNKKRGRKNVF